MFGNSLITSALPRHLRFFAVAFAAIALFPTLASCGEVRTDKALYNQLSDIMAERKRLWETPVSEGGTREVDISDIVCPVVTEETLEDMYVDPSIPKDSMPVSGEAVQYDYFETSQVYPDQTRRWALIKPIGIFGTAQVLDIAIAPGKFCEARYRHMS